MKRYIFAFLILLVVTTVMTMTAMAISSAIVNGVQKDQQQIVMKAAGTVKTAEMGITDIVLNDVNLTSGENTMMMRPPRRTNRCSRH